ncbi:MAG: sporulation protein YqfC [Eubacteriales bacterium]|nr:sporulation protein YqfC [Bacillota bacterium]MBV1727163.1 sporulation protein YqfC [Desulforudis sp.]MDP3051471.1 sporulation protein YqfC [Eubacteriales bacterium]MBU4533797.1 sporulation protein YqfC [Bacillota bacterium]MBV1736346.1 sporulation protein YqfC [Desulforudis sp.]
MAWSDVRRKARRAVADIFEIPGEVALDLPKIVLLGNVQVFIENHRGIVEYTNEVVRVVVPSGEVSVHGQGLILRNIQKDEICVEGEIESLSFV